MVKKIHNRLSRRQFLVQSSTALMLTSIAEGQVSDDSVKSKDDCVFCQIAANKKAARKLWEDTDFVAFLDIKPINPGHTLLIPKKHFEYLFELHEPLYSRIFKRAKILAKPLRAAMNSRRIGVLVEGFGVAHLHIHLVPINKGDGFGSRKGNPATEAELKETAKQIRDAIADKK